MFQVPQTLRLAGKSSLFQNLFQEASRCGVLNLYLLYLYLLYEAEFFSRIPGTIPTPSLIGARSEVLENETQVAAPMVDQVDLMEDNFKEVGCLGSTWMETWEAPSGVKYLDKIYERVKPSFKLLLKEFNINLQ